MGHLEMNAGGRLGDQCVVVRGPVGTVERDRAEALGAGREFDRGAGLLDRDFPLVAGDVPVEFVVVVEKPEAVQGVVLEDHMPGSVLGVRDPDLELEVVPLAALLDLEGVPVVVGHAYQIEPDRPVEPLRSPVLDRDGPKDAVPVAGEPGRDRLGDVEAGVRIDLDGRVELLDDEGPFLRRERGRGQSQRESQPEPLHGAFPRSIWGAARSPWSPMSKNSRGLKPNVPARRLAGNWAIRVLRSRITAL